MMVVVQHVCMLVLGWCDKKHYDHCCSGELNMNWIYYCEECAKKVKIHGRPQFYNILQIINQHQHHLQIRAKIIHVVPSCHLGCGAWVSLAAKFHIIGNTLTQGGQEAGYFSWNRNMETKYRQSIRCWSGDEYIPLELCWLESDLNLRGAQSHVVVTNCLQPVKYFSDMTTTWPPQALLLGSNSSLVDRVFLP